jgi:hypothetical protein
MKAFMDALILALIGRLNLNTEYDTRVELPNIVITNEGNKRGWSDSHLIAPTLLPTS